MTDETEEFDTCERCDADRLPEYIEPFEVEGQTYSLCGGCREDIAYDIENYRWFERYTRSHHQQAIDALEAMPEILCAHGEYDAGEIVVHTNYVASEVVEDFCDHFGFQITAFRPRWQNDCIIEDLWNCVQEMGDCYEILLEYKDNSSQPLPTEAQFKRISIDYLDESDKQFDADDE